MVPKVVQVQWILGLLLERTTGKEVLSFPGSCYAGATQLLGENPGQEQTAPTQRKAEPGDEQDERTLFEQLDTAMPEVSDLKLSRHVRQ